jgi:hypothetical protein
VEKKKRIPLWCVSEPVCLYDFFFFFLPVIPTALVCGMGSHLFIKFRVFFFLNPRVFSVQCPLKFSKKT